MSATYCTYCPHKNYTINSFSPYNTLRALLIILFIPTTVISTTGATVQSQYHHLHKL